MLEEVKKEVKKASDLVRAKHSQRFFKTGKGEYGYGDVFLGLTVPRSRAIAKKYYALKLDDVIKLLKSKIHEERLIALVILNHQFLKGSEKDREKIYRAYLRNSKYINNWDLVDISAHKIVGLYLFDKKRDVLEKLAKSKLIWDRRIAIISTAYFISKGQFKDTLKLAKVLLNDKEDLIHKAVGWMLREVGNRDMAIEEKFLKTHYKKMPRTMLRYAIEKFPEKKRQAYLKGRI